MYRSKIYTSVTDEQFLNIYRHADSYSDMCRRLHVSVTGGNINTVKKRLNSLDIDIASPLNEFPQKKLAASHNAYKDPTEIFKQDSHARYYTLTKYMINFYHIPYECAICHLKSIWCGKQLVLQVDHINGDHSDCRIENLRFLCPNCHSQTATWSGRKLKHHDKK